MEVYHRCRDDTRWDGGDDKIISYVYYDSNIIKSPEDEDLY